jgi:hypothetical protein
MSSRAFQRRVAEWMTACFPRSSLSDVSERTHRFLEEALELAQAQGCPREDALALLDYVYGRPEGERDQEVGGVLVTLAGLCNATGVSMDDAGDRELERNWARIDRIRRKQAVRPQGSPLPQ